MGRKCNEGDYICKDSNRIILPENDPVLKNTIQRTTDGRVVFRYRSSWEGYFMEAIEMNPSIIKWGYENDRIEYYDPTTILPDGMPKKRNYHIDFVILYDNGTLEYVEVKPYHETYDPENPPDEYYESGKSKGKKKPKKKLTKKQLAEAKTVFVKNSAKWGACRKYCEAISKTYGVNCIFSIVTEKDRLKDILKQKGVIK